MKNKKFDCVEMKNEIQKEIQHNIKTLTPSQQIEYFEKKSLEGKLSDWWKKVKAVQNEIPSAVDSNNE